MLAFRFRTLAWNLSSPISSAPLHQTLLLLNERPNFSSRRHRKLHGREELLRNIRAYADSLFQGVNDDFEDEDSSSSKGPSWFRNQHSRGPKNSNARSKRWGKKGFDFCEEDVEVETIFRSAFGGDRNFYWSFINDEQPRRNRSYEHFWRHRKIHEDDDYNSSSESDGSSELDLVSERRTLGLSASGPLKLEDVKTAYRTCALKWHPDRHQGSSKAVAEEKFKVCSAAYESLCNKLGMA
ncbi:unnamed protein product [Linum tenue]|uniref:J domain-containing protein n=1 Tax=Linum tenue TaxID=586396 RepID=A0AAV0IZ19_9ROSI|nr:unnamed protein product [Linum tenue]